MSFDNNKENKLHMLCCRWFVIKVIRIINKLCHFISISFKMFTECYTDCLNVWRFFYTTEKFLPRKLLLFHHHFHHDYTSNIFLAKKKHSAINARQEMKSQHHHSNDEQIISCIFSFHSSFIHISSSFIVQNVK